MSLSLCPKRATNELVGSNQEKSIHACPLLVDPRDATARFVNDVSSTSPALENHHRKLPSSYALQAPLPHDHVALSFTTNVSRHVFPITICILRLTAIYPVDKDRASRRL
jgi:hypothetical protein